MLIRGRQELVQHQQPSGHHETELQNSSARACSARTHAPASYKSKQQANLRQSAYSTYAVVLTHPTTADRGKEHTHKITPASAVDPAQGVDSCAMAQHAIPCIQALKASSLRTHNPAAYRTSVVMTTVVQRSELDSSRYQEAQHCSHLVQLVAQLGILYSLPAL
jgi:hypothetical protein